MRFAGLGGAPAGDLATVVIFSSRLFFPPRMPTRPRTLIAVAKDMPPRMPRSGIVPFCHYQELINQPVRDWKRPRDGQPVSVPRCLGALRLAAIR